MKSCRDSPEISPQMTVSLVSYVQIPLFLGLLQTTSYNCYLWNMLNQEESITLPIWPKRRGISLFALMGMPTETKASGLLMLTHS